MKSKVLAILPSLLTIVGTFLIGRNLLGQVITESYFQEITGTILLVAGVVAGIIDGTAVIEKIQAAAIKLLLVGGSLLVASGKLTETTLNGIIGVATVVIPLIYQFLSRKKSQQLESGKISVDQLKK